jgi:hypothetical protein
MQIELVKDLIEKLEETPSIVVNEDTILSNIAETKRGQAGGGSFNGLDESRGGSFTKWYTESDNILNSESIIMLICLSFGIFLMILFILYIGYYFSWWRFYNRIACLNCANLALCNCIYCYHTCPLFESKAKRLSLSCRNNQLGSSAAGPRMFVQDLLATNDGRVIKLTDLREVNQQNDQDEDNGSQFSQIQKSSSLKFMNQQDSSNRKSILKTNPSIRSSNYISQLDLV